MSVEAPGTIPAVTGAIRHASRMTGTNFQYLVATAQVESRSNPTAAAPTSTARGLFQFIEQTWLGTLKEQGPSLGYNHIANVIERGSSGQYVVNDPKLSDRILNMRNDPTMNAVMAAAYTKSNASKLAERLGRKATEGELYVAHFLGSQGGGRLIELANGRPGMRADEAFPTAARSNPSIFYDKGKPRSVGDVYRTLVNRYAAARKEQPAQARAAQQPAAGPQLASASSTLVTAPQSPRPAFAPDTAELTSAYAAAEQLNAPLARLADHGPVFHGLFRNNREAVSPVVSALWSAPTPVSEQVTPETVATPNAQPVAVAQTVQPQQAVAVTPPPAGGTMSLFQDLPTDTRALFRGRV